MELRLGPPYDITTPAVTTNKNIKLTLFKSSENTKMKENKILIPFPQVSYLCRLSPPWVNSKRYGKAVS